MDTYGRELAAGDTTALKERYDPETLLGLVNEQTIVQTTQDSASWDGWQRPIFFAWDSLTFDVATPGVALVLGRFRMVQPKSPDTVLYSYAALLRRTPVGWRIRSEIETQLK